MTPLLVVVVVATVLFVCLGAPRATVADDQYCSSSTPCPGWNATDVAIITVTYYSGQGCTGTITDSYNITTGYCTGSETYYVNADGSKIYRSHANFNNCTQVTSYYEAPMGVCIGQEMYTAINPSWGPALPVSFPPSGWSLTAYYINVTSGYITRGCSNGADTVPYREAVQMGGCDAEYSYDGAPQTWSGIYCTPDGQSSGLVRFSDSACTNVVATYFGPLKTCDVSFSCPVGVGVLTTFPSTAVITTTYYSGEGCTGNVTGSVNMTTGYCDGWESLYASADGSKIYQADYDNGNCTQVTAYEETPTGVCVENGITTVINPSWGPPLPVSFPPAGFALTVYYRNVTSGRLIGDCSRGADTVPYRRADLLGGCYPDYSYGGAPQTWSGQYCSSDGQASGTVLFSDSSCTTPVATSYFFPVKSCEYDWLITSCPSSGGGILTNFPTIAIIQTDNPSCTVNTNSVINTYASGFCQNYQIVTCSTNPTTGEVDVLISHYSTPDCTFAPTSTVYHKQECEVDQESYYNGVTHISPSYISYSCGYSYTNGSIVAGRTSNDPNRPVMSSSSTGATGIMSSSSSTAAAGSTDSEGSQSSSGVTDRTTTIFGSFMNLICSILVVSMGGRLL